MMVAVTRHVVAGGMNGAHGVGIALRQGAADHKCRFEIMLLENPEDAPNSDPRPVFAPSVFFGIDAALGIRLQAFRPLIVKDEIDGAAIGCRPFELFSEKDLLQHIRPPLDLERYANGGDYNLCVSRL